MASKEEARKVVREITKKYGHLSDEFMDRIEEWDPDARRTIEEGWLALESMAAHSIKTLAKQIYGSGARFVFELLQNADDNRFVKAKKKNEQPSISFQVYPDRIVVDCNEDGFRKCDLEAICAVGQSTKSTSYGYIGAKGIGFKSVFIAASKVHIQSGHFSFYFKHEKGDPGLGMVRPVWQEDQEKLPTPLTRMTLYLHKAGDSKELEHLKGMIIKQFEDLQATSLLFLRNLQRISVSIYSDDGSLKSSKNFQASRSTPKVILKMTTITRGEKTEKSRVYHVTKYKASKLAKSDNRDLSDSEEAREMSSTAEVVLAFPTTTNSEAIIENQEIFAFLPVRESEYKFLIQADFDTSANRQDIITTSRRNMDLLDAIAYTFVKAVLQFCDDPVLCYQWPRYLPRLDTSSKTPTFGSSRFWSSLNEKIKSKISQTPVIRSRHKTELRQISDIWNLDPGLMDELGDSLYDDRATDPFMAKQYRPEDRNILGTYGLATSTASHHVELLKSDLKSPKSRMKNFSMRDAWHAKAAATLRSFLETKSKSIITKIQNLPLLPLQNGRWVSAANKLVFLPTTREIPIPTYSAMNTIDPRALVNSDREMLFHKLGVEEALVSDVRLCIALIYEAEFFQDFSLKDSINHLHYLYLTHDDTFEQIPHLRVYTMKNELKKPSKVDFYISNDHPHGPKMLLEQTDTAPGKTVNYLHSSYLEACPERGFGCPSWENWLYDHIGIRRRLRLVAPMDRNSPSSAFAYVATHRSDMVLGMLEFLWKHQSNPVKQNQELKKKISKLCKFGSKWLPFPSLRRKVEFYTNNIIPSPFLFDVADIEDLEGKWIFLHKDFGIGRDSDVKFLLHLLDKLSIYSDPPSIKQTKRVAELYLEIEASITVSDDGSLASQQVVETISNCCILMPEYLDDPGEWASYDVSRWEGPPNMISICCLKQRYVEILGDAKTQELEHFFRNHIGIQDLVWNDIVEELEVLQDGDWNDFDRVERLYELLSSMEINHIELRDEFEQKKLILVNKSGSSSWHPTSECLWSSSSDVRNKVTLNGQYDELEGFFTKILGVQSLTLQMIYDEILQSDSRKPIDVLKNEIQSLNSLLQTEQSNLEAGPLLKAKIFPVEDPGNGTTLQSIDTDFAIGDSRQLAARFKGHIKLLDYSIEEVRQLRPFFNWASLTTRYLSQSIKEFTRVAPNAIRRPVTEKKHDLRRKAYQILRIARTFQSPRYQKGPEALYRVLREAKVIETDKITSTVQISQDGNPVTLEEAAGEEHIDETDVGLMIYVPLDLLDRDFCFTSTLPLKFADWLMRDRQTLIPNGAEQEAVEILRMVLSCDLANVDRVIDRYNILEVNLMAQDLPAYGDEEVETIGERSQGVAASAPQFGSSVSLGARPAASEARDSVLSSAGLLPHRSDLAGSPESSRARTPSEVSVEEPVIIETSTEQAVSREATHFNQLPLWRPPSSRTNTSVEPDGYLELLTRVVSASRRATFPSRGAFDMTNLFNGLPDLPTAGGYETFDGLDHTFRFRSDSQLERDKKVGAAGELYVFELLSTLDLPNWGRDNWQSTIRKYVKVHRDYRDMAPWNQRETADIVYQDISGDFTTLLIENGYLQDEWRDARPKYLIEVKTSTGPLATPFYMSKNQYRLNIHSDQERLEVYMILRVFFLGDERVGMRIYLDPEQLRQDGGLVFTGETWSVIPGRG